MTPGKPRVNLPGYVNTVPHFASALATGRLVARKFFTVDTRAIQHIVHTSGYRYKKCVDITQMNRNMFGRGILWASGNVHKRHRKVINPAFVAQQLRSFLLLFQTIGSCMTRKYSAGKSGSIYPLEARSTLDVIGQGIRALPDPFPATFDYHLGALDDARDELFRSMDSLLHCGATYPDAFSDSLSFKTVCRRIAQQLFAQKIWILPQRMDQDGISFRANASEDPQHQLDEDEVLSQMRTIILAGHDTVPSSLSWMLYELAKHPDAQRKIREEIRALRAQLPDAAAFTVADLDSLPYTNATIKEALRLHPILPTIFRTAEEKDIVLLAMPIVTSDRQTIKELHAKKGQDFSMSISGYSRLQSV
ncbi:cytochrome P450 [Pleurotus eryngii]|uniref:Cytochrome P450 n=1 Tax=Pleurotus eryngii TaxID=5323 RepID=A0A9P5ZIR2_PLEER|nr:cytochrome P450 [Pleurotus eryngii]